MVPISDTGRRDRLFCGGAGEPDRDTRFNTLWFHRIRFDWDPEVNTQTYRTLMEPFLHSGGWGEREIGKKCTLLLVLDFRFSFFH